MENVKAFVSWSGGKDCCLSHYLATKNGLTVEALVSAIDHTGKIGAHSLRPEIIGYQAKALQVPLIQKSVTVATYDDDFRSVISKLRDNGITTGVFGDVSIGNKEADLHKNWVENICYPLDIRPYLPLWGLSRNEIMLHLINMGFEVIIIVADEKHLGKSWLGRKLDLNLLNELNSRHTQGTDGKVGYYHTFVLDGPLFRQRLNITNANPIRRIDEWGDNWYLDIEEIELIPKRFTDKPYLKPVLQEVRIDQITSEA
ncbi:diphthine--ammonia ligase [Dehalococcoides sp. THU3]|uniref:Dph6-related ATP pyrophosphatase n=1 Tax=Dehalococcoides TaxID=61434 RepID=UPI0032187A87